MSTGVKGVDALTDGGFGEGTATLLLGPSFCGKRALARRFLLQGMAERVPAIYVSTDETASRLRKTLIAMDPSFEAYEAEGLIRFVDVYSQQIGAGEELPSVRYVSGPADLNAITVAINEGQRELIGEHEHHRVVIDSASTLVAHTSAQAAFRFLHVLLGKVQLAGGTSVVLLERGMHQPEEVETIKHVMDGVIEFTEEDERSFLRFRGAGKVNQQGWVAYEADETSFEVTGSLAEGRIL